MAHTVQLHRQSVLGVYTIVDLYPPTAPPTYHAN